MSTYLECSKIPQLVTELVNFPSISRASHLLLGGISRNLTAHTASQSTKFSEFTSMLRETTSSRELRCGDLEIIPPNGNALIFSDLEGDLKNLFRLFEREKIIDQLNDPFGKLHLIFLGDLIDRSEMSLPLLEFVLFLKSHFPSKVHYIAGNHELSPSVQKQPRGFADELQNRKFKVTPEEWRELRALPFFRDFIRGSENPFEGHSWITNDEYRYGLMLSYLDALRGKRAESPLTVDLEESCSKSSEDSLHHSTDNEVLIRSARESIGKMFVWDLAQRYFSTLPKMIVSKNFVAVHGLPPCSANLSPSNLLSGTQSGDEILFDIARSFLLPVDLKSSRYEEMVWSDLTLPPRTQEPCIPFNIVRNDKRNAGYEVALEVPSLFLSVIERPLLFRGHQRFSHTEDYRQHPVYTIDSSGTESVGVFARVDLSSTPTASSVTFGELT